MAFKLPRLFSGWDRQPDLLIRYLDEFADKIEETLNAILAIPIIEEALVTLEEATEAAQTAADNAQTAADAANSAAAATALEASLTTSYVGNFTAPLISADSLGDVIIANHDRIYGDATLNPTKAVTGDTLTTGESPGSIIRVYYEDSARAGGAVTYLYTVDPTDPPVQKGDTHSVGVVTIPAAGTNAGQELPPPGYVYQ